MISSRIARYTTENFAATKRVMIAPCCRSRRNPTPATMNMAMASVMGRRYAGTAGGQSDTDMGGPGGQEAYPFTKGRHRYV